MTGSSTMWKEEELIVIETMKNNQHYLSFKVKSDLDIMWREISEQTGLPMQKCRQNWYRIKKRYLEIKRGKKIPSGRTKYLDGRLSFLDKYFVVHKKEIKSREKKLMTLDIKMIDNLLATRKPKGNINIDEILSLVSKRIDETLSSLRPFNTIKEKWQPNTEKLVMNTEPIVSSLTNTANSQGMSCPSNQNIVSNPRLKVLSLSEILQMSCEPSIDDENSDIQDTREDSNFATGLQSPEGDNSDDDYSSSEQNPQHGIRAFLSPTPETNSCKIPVASMSIPVKGKPKKKVTDGDMETIFEIYRRSDSKTFFQELGNYLERFSEEKIEEIRLKICCIVTETELEEV